MSTAESTSHARGPEVLRAWRASRGWTQEAAARETGYSLHTWGSYETGRLAISPRLWRILDLLDRQSAPETAPEQ